MKFKSGTITLASADSSTNYTSFIEPTSKAIYDLRSFDIECTFSNKQYNLRPIQIKPYVFQGAIISGKEEIGKVYLTLFENKNQDTFVLVGKWEEDKGLLVWDCYIVLKV